eukprot:1632257-Lingulodinium_polyedra.AAC.1
MPQGAARLERSSFFHASQHRLEMQARRCNQQLASTVPQVAPCRPVLGQAPFRAGLGVRQAARHPIEVSPSYKHTPLGKA